MRRALAVLLALVLIAGPSRATASGFQFTVPMPFPNGNSNVTPGFTATTLSASGAKIAFIFQASQTCTVNTVAFKFGTIAQAPVNGIQISFQSVSLTASNPGQPDGTLSQKRTITQANVTNAWQVPGLITSDGTDTGVKRSVTQGDIIAFVIEFVNFAAGDSVIVQAISVGTGSATHGYPSVATNNGASWAVSNLMPVMALQCSDGNYYPTLGGVLPVNLFTNQAYNSGSSPNEYALYFKPDRAISCPGVGFRGSASVQTVSVTVTAYDTDGTTSLGSVVLDAHQYGGLVSQNFDTVLNATPAFKPGNFYRVGIKATTASNFTLTLAGIKDVATMASMPEGANWYESTRTGSGAWTETTTTRPWIWLICTDSPGGGVSAARIPNGS